jgi:hypothetical protein
VGKVIYCHKPTISVALEEIPLWFAKSLCVGDFFEKRVGKAESELLSRELRRGALATSKAKRLTVSCLESRGEVSYFYLTDGTFTYRMKVLEGKKIAFLMDFGEGGYSRWTDN